MYGSLVAEICVWRDKSGRATCHNKFVARAVLAWLLPFYLCAFHKTQ